MSGMLKHSAPYSPGMHARAPAHRKGAIAMGMGRPWIACGRGAIMMSKISEHFTLQINYIIIVRLKTIFWEGNFVSLNMQIQITNCMDRPTYKFPLNMELTFL